VKLTAKKARRPARPSRPSPRPRPLEGPTNHAVTVYDHPPRAGLGSAPVRTHRVVSEHARLDSVHRARERPPGRGAQVASAEGPPARLPQAEAPGGQGPPFGWKVAPDTVTLLPVGPEQDVIGRMILLRGQGRNPRQIAAELTARGCRRRDGKTVWGAGTVARILAKEGGEDGN